MSEFRQANRTLVYFAVLIIFGIAMTLFLVRKAHQVIADLAEFEHIQMVEIK